jgi:hypothetical protein
MSVTPIIISYPLSGFSAGFWLSLDALGLGLADDCHLGLSGGLWRNCEADNLWVFSIGFRLALDKSFRVLR